MVQFLHYTADDMNSEYLLSCSPKCLRRRVGAWLDCLSFATVVPLFGGVMRCPLHYYSIPKSGTQKIERAIVYQPQ
jgi:hypothetical protein